MRGTTAAGLSPRAVAVGLAVALVVLVVAGRLQQHVLAPEPGAPVRPLTVAPTTTIPPVPVAARIRIRVDADVEAVAVTAAGLWALGGREATTRVGEDGRWRFGTHIVLVRTPTGSPFESGSPGRRCSMARGWWRGRARCGSEPVRGPSGSMPARAG